MGVNVLEKGWTFCLKGLRVDNLPEGNFVVVWSCMCNASGQSIDHLVLHCLLAGILWSKHSRFDYD